MRVARCGLILGVLNSQSLFGWRLKIQGGPAQEVAPFFTPAALVHLVQGTAAGRQVKVLWQTTPWPVCPGDLPHPSHQIVSSILLILHLHSLHFPRQLEPGVQRV